MGKGIALQFKRAFPPMFEVYAQAAKRQELALGAMHVWATDSMTGPCFVINFPTRGRWKAGSRLPDIERGLDDLVRAPGADEAAVASVRGWSQRPGSTSTPDHIAVAIDTLCSYGWTAEFAAAR